jgi:predicted aminopeptidase
VKSVALVALACNGCFYAGYVAQGAVGQVDLLARARPLDEVIHDRKTSLRTALELAEIPAIKTYGRSYGLTIRHNYETYADVERPAAVWFVGASDQTAFKPRKWCFPVAGCFAGVGFFDEDDAIKFQNSSKPRATTRSSARPRPIRPAAGSPTRSCRRCSAAGTTPFRSLPT